MKKYLIKVGGVEYEVEVQEIKEEAQVLRTEQFGPALTAAPAVPVAPAAPAAPKSASAAAPKPAAAKNSNNVPAGAVKITAPMPGTVLKVNVNAGDTVKKGQILLILEAMKMENEIVAPSDGKIADVNVSSGSSVNSGDVLLSMV